MTLLLLAVVAAVITFRITTPDDRARYLRAGVAAARQLQERIGRASPESDAYRAGIRERMPRAWVTMAFAALMAAAVVMPSGLDAWGNAGLRTTNGEWWRLVTATFVHAGFLQALMDVLILIQLGFLLERLVGHAAFAVVFLSAAVFAGLIDVTQQPIGVGSGASGALFGLYGLLVAVIIWSAGQEATLRIPREMLRTMGAWAAIFFAVSLANGSLTAAAEWTGFVVGTICGAFFARAAGTDEAPVRDVTLVAGIGAVLAVAAAVPLRGISDVRPEIQRILTMEDDTSTAYEAAAVRFHKGRLPADALAKLIEETIVPELLAADARLKAFKKVPPEHRPVVADALSYLQLRSESWRLRAAAIRTVGLADGRDAGRPTGDGGWRLKAEARHRANLKILGNAEAAERTSLEAYRKIRTHRAI